MIVKLGNCLNTLENALLTAPALLLIFAFTLAFLTGLPFRSFNFKGGRGDLAGVAFGAGSADIAAVIDAGMLPFNLEESITPEFIKAASSPSYMDEANSA